MINLKDGLVVHCDTEEKAIKFLIECENQGCKWLSGSKTCECNHWDINKENTCYIIESCKSKKNIFYIYYSDLDYFKENNYHILKFNQLNFENNNETEQLSLF